MNRSRKTADLASHGNIFVDIANDRVGIGTTIPTHKIDVSGNIKLHDQTGHNNHITYKSSGPAPHLHFPTGPLSNLARTPYIGFGDRGDSSGDFKIYHDHYNAHLKLVGTGGLFLSNNTGAIGINGANGSGGARTSIYLPAGANEGIKLYHGHPGSLKFETVGYGVTVHGTTETQELNVTGVSTFASNINLGDNDKIILGDGSDLQLFHDGTRSHLSNSTGQLRLGQGGTNVELYYGSVKCLHTHADSGGSVGLFRNLTATDNVKILLGASADLQIYHSGSHSFIDDTGTGNLKLRSNNFRVSNADESKISATFVPAGAVELYHNNSKKFETSSSGATVTGALNVTGDITVPTSMDTTETGGAAIQRLWAFTVSAGDVYKCGKWTTGEGTVQLLIAVRSHTAGNSGTTTYMYQGSFSAIGSLGIRRLMPLTVGTGHGNGPDNGTNSNAWEVLIKNDNNYAYEVYVHVPTGVANKVLRVTVTEVGRGLTFTDISSTVAYSSLTVSSGVILSSNYNHLGYTHLRDNYKINLGNSNDLQIYHDGTHSRLNSATGMFNIQSDDFRVTDAANSLTAFKIDPDGATDLRYNGSVKLQTTNTGISVTGQGVFSSAITASTYIQGTSSNGGLKFYSDSSTSKGVVLNTDDHFVPSHDSNSDLGLTGTRWRNVYADTLYGDGSNLTGITQTTINNNADNRIITGSGTANTLNAESGVTFDGTTLQLAAADDIRIAGGTWTGEYTGGIKIQPDASNAYFQYHGSLYFRNTGGANRFQLDSGGNATFTGSVTATGGFSGSGASLTSVNATTLDSIDSGSFLRSDATDTCSGQITFTSGQLQLSGHHYQGYHSTAQNYIHFYPSNPSSNAGSSAVTTDIRSWNGSSFDVLRIQGGNNTITWRNNTIWHSGNDGAGSGLDADLLDGLSSGSFLRSDQNDDVATHRIEFKGNETNNYDTIATASGSQGSIEVFNNGVGNDAFMAFHTGSDFALYFGLDADNNKLAVGGWSMGANKYAIYHEGNNPTFSQLGITASSINALNINADTVDGLHLGGTGNNGANQIVRTQGNGYIFSSFINTSSGDTGSGVDVTRFYASEDAYIRYLDKASMRAVMNVSARSGAYAGRENNTSDTNYWVGSMGWGTSNFDTTVWDFGSCFFDTWSNPSGQPSGTSHWTGVQAMHYTNASSRYGMRITMGAGQTALAYIQGRWNQTTYGWHKLWNEGNDGSGSGLDADTLDGQQGTYYKDIPSGTVMVFHQNSAPTGWSKSTSHNNKAMRIVSGNVSSGGSNAFSTAFNSSRGTSGGSVSNHTLTTAQMPSHTHTGVAATHDSNSAGSQGYPAGNQHNRHRSTDRPQNNNMAAAAHQNTGSTNSHNHGFSNPSINLNVQYVDFIICTRS